MGPYPRVREYEAWSIPGQLLPAEYAKATLQHELWAEGIPQDVFIGLSQVPGPVHSKILEKSLTRGEYKVDDFLRLCSSLKLLPDIQCAASAAAFLEWHEGRCLAWIHIPEAASHSLLSIIVGLLRQRGHIVIDPANGSCVG